MAGQRAYFGDALEKIDPGLPQALIELDGLSWQVFYQYPRPLRGRLNKVSQRVLDALQAYLAIPKEQRRSQAWFTAALEEAYRQTGLSSDDIASQMLFLYWGINTNISKVGFWIISHILFRPELVQWIRDETKLAFGETGKVNSEYIYHSCPKLNSLWLEALRVSAASTTIRTITRDTIVGGKLLKKGKKLLISARQLHFSSQEFGANVNGFDPTRFLKNPELHRSPAFRPFGGGFTECPGRFLAKYMVLNFVAIALHHFDLRLAAPQAFPKCQESKPSIGITAGDDDLYITFRRRSHLAKTA
ncbi:MAG: hypothetical protein M1822_000542 [Bathelium mastoideum]|nr:MAG: hypothetical protein M1822_000542 [Bathelium mastoideum]